ncbi:MAG: sulfotransferase, partial [Myxococcota bacterium]
WVAAMDQRFLGGLLTRRVEAWEEKRYGGMRDVHEMGLTKYEEDDIVFYYSCASGFWITKMPYLGDLDFYYVDQRPERKRRRLMRFYRDCIRRQLHLNGQDKIHLSKNPVFAGRVETLIEAFPDARIVVPIRNPYETIPSLLKLMRIGWRRLDWDAERQKRCLDVLANQSFHTYTHPLDVLDRHPKTRHAIVDYRQVVEDPEAAITEVYQRLEIPLGDAYREILHAQTQRASRHVSGHAYSLEEFGLDADEIQTRLAGLFETYRWDPPERFDARGSEEMDKE